MRDQILRTITTVAALAVSVLAVAMAWASSMQRASNQRDQFLLAALSVVIVLSVHLLPALLRGRQRLLMWPVWLLCLALAVFGHASWFYLAGESAAEARIAGSAAVAAAAQERATIEQTLRTIKARPVAQVASLLARTTSLHRRAALEDELAESRRAAGLRDRLVAVSGDSAGAAGYTPGTPRVRSGTASGTDVMLVMSVVAAVLVEVIGALLWSAALAGGDNANNAPTNAEPERDVIQEVANVLAPIMARPVHSSGADVVDELADLRAAIARGECRESVRGIREYMGCGSDTASRLKRRLIGQD